MELTRKEVIEILEKADSTVYKEPKTKTAQALEYAISSLKTDEMYQLDYEGVQNIVVTEGMTNGDVIKMMFPHSLFEEHTDSDGYTWMIMWNGIDYQCDFDIDWWNSPYKGE